MAGHSSVVSLATGLACLWVIVAVPIIAQALENVHLGAG